jgi:hypothetical protein
MLIKVETFKKVSRSMNSGDPNYYKIPESYELAAAIEIENAKRLSAAKQNMSKNLI